MIEAALYICTDPSDPFNPVKTTDADRADYFRKQGYLVKVKYGPVSDGPAVTVN